MKKILTIAQVLKTAKRLKAEKIKIILAGGCFDILHFGHITFFNKSKKQGGVLILLLESDEAIRLLKGVKRPVNNQTLRAKILEALEVVDYIVLLPAPYKTPDYNDLVKKLAPDIIAVTEGDPYLNQKKLQAKSVGGKVKIVTGNLKEYSTTKLLGYF